MATLLSPVSLDAMYLPHGLRFGPELGRAPEKNSVHVGLPGGNAQEWFVFAIVVEEKVARSVCAVDDAASPDCQDVL